VSTTRTETALPPQRYDGRGCSDAASVGVNMPLEGGFREGHQGASSAAPDLRERGSGVKPVRGRRCRRQLAGELLAGHVILAADRSTRGGSVPAEVKNPAADGTPDGAREGTEHQLKPARSSLDLSRRSS